jgi:hypothetical protein
MRVRSGPLFWGLLLIPLGAIPLLVRANVIDAASVVDAWRLWPLVLVGLGLALLVRRGRTGVVAIVITALTLGIAGGGALASGTSWLGSVSDCVVTSTNLQHLTSGGAFAAPAEINLELECGQVAVTTTDGSGWTLGADYRGQPPVVTSSSSELRLESPDRGGARHQDWTLGLPAALVRDITLDANAGSATFALSGVQLDQFEADVNAGDLRIDASDGSIGRISITVNAGRARLALGSGSTTGSLATNAGGLQLCVPGAAALILHVPNELTFSDNLAQRGLTREGDTWTRSGTTGAVIDLSIDGTVGSFTLDPEGGC